VIRLAVYHLTPYGTTVDVCEEMANEIRRDLGVKYRPPWAQGRDPEPDRSKPWDPLF
jgi:hypothetical protein